jgi:predicted RNA-binding Zn-ribbon protein involved in translation (DUF1610 family)
MFDKCAGSCYATSLLDNHLCVENSMRHHCPICYEVVIIIALIVWRSNFFFIYKTDISVLFSVVFIWFTKRNYCNEMRAHYAWWMLRWDDKAWQVSGLQFLFFFSSDVHVKNWFLIELITFTRYCCPICSKSIIDMSKTWERIDEEVSYY